MLIIEAHGRVAKSNHIYASVHVCSGSYSSHVEDGSIEGYALRVGI